MDRIPELASVLARMTDAELIAKFLCAMFTPSELRDLSGRWEVVKRLRCGRSQRSIAHDLGMSLCKITRGSRELKKPDSCGCSGNTCRPMR
jgi:TrpR family trp operon transcriptional repressor